MSKNYNSALQSNNTDLQAILNIVNELPEAVEQATPIINVNSSGLITATAGTKSSTHQLAFQAAKTITPTTASQIAVSSGYYTGGNVTVAGDSNLVAGNIKSGISIFGVSGTYAGSGGGDTTVEDSLVMRTATTYTNDRVTSIGSSAFYYYSRLTSVSFPAATLIGTSAFANCSNLTSVSFPVAEYIYDLAFRNCSKLTSVSFPVARDIGNSVFQNCSKLTSVSFPVAKYIGNYAFQNCSNLTSIYLKYSSLCTFAKSNAFFNTRIKSTTGSIFVPSSLVASYKKATNWVYFSNRIYGVKIQRR